MAAGDEREAAVAAIEAAPAEATGPESAYGERRARFGAERDHLAARSARVANLRLVAFVAAALGCGWGLWQGQALVVALGLLLLGGFGVLVVHHRRIERARRRAAALWQLNDEALHRLARRWEALPLRHTARADPSHAYAADLDLLGPASLMHLLDTTTTALGEATLVGWLLAPAAPTTVAERQSAGAELAPLLDLRQELAVWGQATGAARPDPEPFLGWCEDAPWLRRRPLLLWAGRASVALLWGLALAQAVGLVPGPLWLAPLALHVALLLVILGPVRAVLHRAAVPAGGLIHFADALAVLTAAPLRAPALTRLQGELTAEGEPADRHLRHLERLTTFIMPPSSLPYILIQLATLWDLHLLAALEGWQRGSGRRVRRWLTALGEAEALGALAGLAHDNPAWAYPRVEPAAGTVAGRGLGHPLLPAAARVVNDVEIGPAGSFLFVTGSNMSGKSTLLRAIGVNCVLAGAGGPACVAALRLPPVSLWTCMRVQDSLARGVSYYLAELLRLKQVVDAARGRHAPTEPVVLFLLDEILQGTNTAERQIAARRIIGFLVSRGALGAVSTHDLTLADAPPLADAASPVHFVETITGGASGPVMTFDYRLRPGLATSTNALRLMAVIGLTLEEEPGAEC